MCKLLQAQSDFIKAGCCERGSETQVMCELLRVLVSYRKGLRN